MAKHARVIALGALLWPGPAAAQVQARATLSYQVEASTPRCPNEAEFRDTVSARLGYDPFVASAEPTPTEIHVHLSRQGRTVRGSMSVGAPGADGSPATRQLESPHGDCREIADTLATTIAIRLDPASLTRAPEDPPPPPPSAAATPPATEPELATPPPAAEPAPAPAPPEPQTTPSTEPRSLSFIAHLDGALSLELPSPAPLGQLSAGLRLGWFSVELEGSMTAYGSKEVTLGQRPARAAAALWTGALPLCVHVRMLFGCAVPRLGALRAEGRDLDQPGYATLTYASLGPRFGLELPLLAPLFVRVWGEMLAPLTATRLAMDTQPVWRSPQLSARFGLGLGFSFR